MCESTRTEYDWMIDTIIENKNDINNPESEIGYCTLGFDKYGYGEIIAFDKVCNAGDVFELINRFGLLLKNGKKFDSDFIHWVSNADVSKIFRFEVFYGKHPINDNKWIQLQLLETKQLN